MHRAIVRCKLPDVNRGLLPPGVVSRFELGVALVFNDEMNFVLIRCKGRMQLNVAS